jgi:hypothetical protein
MVVATLTAGAFIAAAGPLGSAFVTASVVATTGSLTMVGGSAVGGITGAVSGGLGAALNGGNPGDVLRGAAISGVQGAITGGLLHGQGVAADGASGSARVGLHAAHAAGHGMVGGATNVAMGGNYKDGFYSAALAAEVTSYGPFVNTGSAGSAAGVIARTIQASVVGGTVSVIGGGKFVNAAYTTAYQHLLNFELPASADKVKSMQDVARVKSAINESLTTSSSQPVNLCDAELSIIMKRYKYSSQIRNPGLFGWAYDTTGYVDTYVS